MAKFVSTCCKVKILKFEMYGEKFNRCTKCNKKCEAKLSRKYKHTLRVKSWEFKNILLELYNYRCSYCKATDHLTIDHIIPLSKNGTIDIENLQILCKQCNNRKSDSISI